MYIDTGHDIVEANLIDSVSDPTEFNLNSGVFPEGIVVAIISMRKHEESIFSIKAKYACKI
jgi:hypothetical protein